MSQLAGKLMDAQKYAMSIRPKVGGFPVLAEVLRQAGFNRNRWSLPSCQSVYTANDGAVLQQGSPLVVGVHEVPPFNCNDLIGALRNDQLGESTFGEFLQAAWNAGVVGYDVDLIGRKVFYYGALGEVYTEAYPAVELNR